MTVCIAAICQGPMIVLASDRQYTVGEHWKYEIAQTKHHSFSPHTVGLVSGNISNCLTIVLDANKKLGQISGAQDTRRVADCVAEAFAEYRRAEAERCLLAPLGLTLEELTTNPALPASLVSRLIREMRTWELGDSFIVAGIDLSTELAHIYSILDPGWASCEDAPAYVVVGSGSDHAMALFIRQKYHRNWSAPHAVFLAYSAKRHAEVDPYVGSETDMYLITPAGGYGPLHVALKERLEKVYEESASEGLKITGETYRRYEEDVVKFIQEQPPQNLVEGDVQTSAPTPNEIPGEAEEVGGEARREGGT